MPESINNFYYNESITKKIIKIDNPEKDVSYLEKHFKNNLEDFLENGSFEDIFIFLRKNKQNIDLKKLNDDYIFYLQSNFLNEFDLKKIKLISEFLEENYPGFNNFTVENYLSHKSKFELSSLKNDIAEKNFNISFEYFLKYTNLEQIINFLETGDYSISRLRFEVDSYIFNQKFSLISEKNPETETKISFILKFLEERIPGYRGYKNYLNNF